MYRRLQVAMAISIMLMASGVLFLLVVPSDRITQANCNRIRPGLSATQVEDILGRKPDGVINLGGNIQRTWIGRTGSIDVTFDGEGNVVSRMPFLQFREASILERIRSWIPS
jgi:hypothetical protein